jgi:hypothetical protein
LLLMEPIGAGPWRDFVDRHGNAVHHIAFRVGDYVDDAILALQRTGARRVLGRPGLGYAQCDCTDDFGMIVGAIGRKNGTPPSPVVSQIETSVLRRASMSAGAMSAHRF